MSDILTITPETLERALATALREDIGRLDIEALTMVDAHEAAKMLAITPQAFRRLALDSYDFGERRTRWSISEVRKLIQTRRVRHQAKP